MDVSVMDGPTLQLYKMIALGERALNISELSEEEKKIISDNIVVAKAVVVASCEGYSRTKSLEEVFKCVSDRNRIAANNLAEKKMLLANLQCEHNGLYLKLQLAQATVENLMSSCRSLTICSNQINNQNICLEAQIAKKQTHWNTVTNELSMTLNRVNELCLASPKLNANTNAVKIIEDLRCRLKESQNERDLIIRQKEEVVTKIQNAKPFEMRKTMMKLCKTLLKLYDSADTYKKHLIEKEQIRSQLEESSSQPWDDSACDLDTTFGLMTAATAYGLPIETQQTVHENGEKDSNECPVQDSLVVTQDAEIANTIVDEDMAEEQYNIIQTAINENVRQLEEEMVTPCTDTIPEENVVINQEEIIHSNNQYPEDSSFSQSNVEPIREMEGNEGFTDNILDISLNSNDPGGDFLSLIGGDKDKGAGGDGFSFSMFDGDTEMNDAPGGFDFNFDSTNNEQEQFNFFEGDSNTTPDNTGFFNFFSGN